jgi:hypothetical protein
LDGELTTKIVFLAVALYVEATIFPGAIVSMITASFGTTAYGALLQPLFSQLVPLIAIVSTVVLFLKYVTS